MISTELESLSLKVGELLSEKRYNHTLGVVRTAEKISSYVCSDSTDEIAAAALLHDVAKELSTKEQLEIIKEMNGVTESDLICEPAYHSLCAPVIIKRQFPEFATPNILSAVKNHTLGSPDMSLFDEIIFVADYIEDTRIHSACIAEREALYSALSEALDREECVTRLHESTLRILENTISHIIKRRAFLHERAVSTRNAFLGRLPMLL